MSAVTFLVIVLILVIVFGAPINPIGWNRNGGYGGSTVTLALLIIVVVLALTGRI